MKQFLILFFLYPFILVANPFSLDLPLKDTLTLEDYVEIQSQLKKKALELDPLLEQWYPNPAPTRSLLHWSRPLSSKEDFKNRIYKGTTQILIDLEHNKLPQEEIIQINRGGPNCLVCYVTFNGQYEKLVKELPKHLEKVGFNGHLFCKIGGYPNPTGKEIQYCAVPYCFKIFTLLEAQKKGAFDKVLWIDAAFVPLKDPTPLFDWIDQHGYFFKMHAPFSKYILPKTRKFIQDTMQVDVLESRYVSAQIIGFNLKHPFAQEFISEYYKQVEVGFPFLSCFPEEYVFSAIVGKDPAKWTPQPFTKLSFSEEKLRGRDVKWVQSEGYFFLQHIH
ncbi:MAG: hypothetical protein FJZ58_08540 [Chlamydiae bacterium]|nr:hypothetical protein [Chlamydiota bacterium]